MTEIGWLAWKDFGPLLRHLRAIGYPFSERKFRLLALAYCRAALTPDADPRFRQAAEILERYADGHATEGDLAAARQVAFAARPVLHAPWQVGEDKGSRLAAYNGWEATTLATSSREEFASDTERQFAKREGDCLLEGHLADVARDLFGNPFRPVALDPAWLAWNDGVVVRLAEAAYQGRALLSGRLDHRRLALVADALEDACCSNPFLLGHLRQPGVHVRGCWAVDVLTGRA